MSDHLTIVHALGAPRAPEGPWSLSPSLASTDIEGGGWVFLRLTGEEADQGDSFFSELVQELEELDEAITALAFPRRESSHTGDRQMPVVRAWRAGTTRFDGGWPDAGATTAGHTAVASDLSLALDRGALSACQDHLRAGELNRRAWLAALAERRETSGDWLAATQQVAS